MGRSQAFGGHPLGDRVKCETLDVRHREMRFAQDLLEMRRYLDLCRDARTGQGLNDAINNLLGFTNFWRSRK